MTNLQDVKLGVYEKAIPLQLSWGEKMRVAKNAGFDFIELSIDGEEPRIARLEWTDEFIREIRWASTETGLPLLTMALTANRRYPLGDDRPEIRRRGLEIVFKAIDLAVKLGIRMIQLAAYDVVDRPSTDTTFRLFREALVSCTERASLRGVMLALEVMHDVPRYNTVEKMRGLVNEIASPFLNIYTDIGNVACLGVNPAADLHFGGNYLVACHLKDALPGCCRKVTYGDGVVNFGDCFRALMDMNYHGFFIAEMWSDENLDFIPYLSTAAGFIRRKIGEAGTGV